MVRAVFFDVANTLLDKPSLYPRMQDVLNRYGHAIPDPVLRKQHRLLSELMTFPDKTSRDFYSVFNAELLMSMGIVPEEQLVMELFDSCTYLPWAPFSDTAFLDEIDKPIGVLSNWDNSLKEKLASNFKNEFKWILGSQETGVRKPDRGFFARMIEVSGCNADEILYIGDSLKLDIIPAIQFGIKAVLVDRNNLYPYCNVNRIQNLKELADFL